MTQSTLTANHGMRRDLKSSPADGDSEDSRLIVDDLGGRITRVSERFWSLLHSGTADPDAWSEATAAGWTRSRHATSRRSFNPLMIEIPLGSIDRVAQWSSRHFGWVFSRTAVTLAVVLIASVASMSLLHAAEIISQLPELGRFVVQANPLWLLGMFWTTKLVHELAHATACRVMGMRCGHAGLLILCGMPCPFVDVTQSHRLSKRSQRAAVMMAGIYVELIVASIAMVVWMTSDQLATRLMMLNLAILCSVSTLVFNANPLMRFDGYFVLADWINSVNLRLEASHAFQRSVIQVATRPFLAKRKLPTLQGGEPSSTGRLRQLGLSTYHVASGLYRWLVLATMAGLLITLATAVQLRTAAIGLVVVMFLFLIVAQLRKLHRFAKGAGGWDAVPPSRRMTLVAVMFGGVIALLVIPFPRSESITGFIDVPDATTVYCQTDGVVEVVHAQWGEAVNQGEILARLNGDVNELRLARLASESRVAQQRIRLMRRASLLDAQAARSWQTLQASGSLIRQQLSDAKRRSGDLELRATATGRLIPASADFQGSRQRPSELAGRSVEMGQPWCRIVSQDDVLSAVLTIDAQQRSNTRPGMEVLIRSRQRPEQVIRSRIRNISPLALEEDSVLVEASFRIVCPLATMTESGLQQRDLLSWIDSPCDAVLALPARSLLQDVIEFSLASLDE
ncbi:MAG: hypothetical protein AAGA03_08715 [Planctomycetota bacterium]